MRNYGNIATAIWRDPDFIALSINAQRTYMLIITQQDISSVGTLAITLRRWSRMASDSTQECLSDGLAELEDARFIALDWEHEELLVRTFVKWDGGHTNPKRLLSIKAAAVGVTSPILGPIMSAELTSLGIAHETSFPQVDSHSIADRTPTDPPRVVVTNVTTDSTTHTPQQETTTRVRGTRLADDWQPDATLIEWVKVECPSVNGRAETENFRDYWHAKAGKDAAKIDWPATYRRWMRTAQERSPSRASPKVNGYSTGEQRAMDAAAAAQQVIAARQQNHHPAQIGPA